MTPISTWSSLAYAVVGGLLLWADWSLEAGVMALALTALAAGSFWMHGGPFAKDAETADHAGIHGVLAALATYAVGGPWWIMLAAAVAGAYVLEVDMDVKLRPAVGTYIYFTGLGVLLYGSLWWGASGLAALGLALWYHGRGGDLNHAAWHVVSSAGLLALYLAV